LTLPQSSDYSSAVELNSLWSAMAQPDKSTPMTVFSSLLRIAEWGVLYHPASTDFRRYTGSGMGRLQDQLRQASQKQPRPRKVRDFFHQDGL